MFHEQFVSAPIPNLPYSHASTLIELQNGDLLCAWYAATEEKTADQTIFLTRLPHGMNNWESPRALIGGKLAQGNPVLYQRADGQLWLIYVEMVLPLDWEKCRIHIVYSSDHGVTWGERRVLVEFLGYMPRNHPLCLRGGSIVLPLYDEHKGRSVFLISRDGGAIWELGGDIITRPGNEQAALAELSDGSLIAFMRTREAPAYIWESRSSDGGWNWSPSVRMPFPNPDAAVDVIHLANGHLVLAFNNSGIYRTPLSVALSTDDGKTWTAVANIETAEGDFDYPSMVVDQTGIIHITYSYQAHRCIKHVALDEAWILQNAARSGI